MPTGSVPSPPPWRYISNLISAYGFFLIFRAKTSSLKARKATKACESSINDEMKRKGSCIVLLCILFAHVIAQDHKSEAWNAVQPYFAPPAEFQGVYGDYRSPRRFYNGDSVRTAEDWARRAREIRDKWMEMMGEWPAILTDQTLVIVETEKREDFIQHLVRF